MNNVLTYKVIHDAWQHEVIPDSRLLLTMKGNLECGTYELFAGKHFAAVQRNSVLFETTECFFCNMLGSAATYYLATFLFCVVDWRLAQAGQLKGKHIDYTYPVEMLAYFIANKRLFERNAILLKQEQLVAVKLSVALMGDHITELNLLTPSLIEEVRQRVAKFLA